MSQYGDGLGPRVDLDAPVDVPEDGIETVRRKRKQEMSSGKSRGGGGLGLAVASLFIALVALGLGLMNTLTGPSPQPGPPPDPKLALGGTAERVAKLEKDVQELMLGMTNLEKKLKAAGSASGGTNSLAAAELASQVAVLRLRVDKLARRAGRGEGSRETTRSTATEKPRPAVVEKPKPVQTAKGTSRRQPAGTLQTIKHRVRMNQTLYGIASKYRVTVAEIRNWNGLSRHSYIKPGQMLVIYK